MQSMEIQHAIPYDRVRAVGIQREESMNKIEIGYCKWKCPATSCKTGIWNCQKCSDYITDDIKYITELAHKYG